MKKTIFCKICNVDTKLVADSFGRWHLNKVHKITTKQYYDLYLKQKKEGHCLSCKEKSTKYISLNQGYLKFCSIKYTSSNKRIQKKIKETKKHKYKNENFNNRNKAKVTLNKKYGLDNVSQIPEIKNKKIKTSLINFGVEHPTQSEIIKNKTKETCIKKYGSDNPSKVKKFQQKRVQTIIDKYGVEHYSKTVEYRKLQEELGKWIPLEFKSDFEIYRMFVWKETNKHIKKLFIDWNGKCYYTNENLLVNKKEYNNPLYATIEHKISIFDGFKNKIDPEIIGNIDNLCICSRIINTIKGIKTEKQFLNYLKLKSKK